MRLWPVSRETLAEIKEQVAPKIGRAVAVLHDVDYGVVIDTHSLDIDDTFVIASIAADLGSVNPRRIRVKTVGGTIRVVFDPTGLRKKQADKEAIESFTAVRKKLIHRVAKIRMYGTQ